MEDYYYDDNYYGDTTTGVVISSESAFSTITADTPEQTPEVSPLGEPFSEGTSEKIASPEPEVSAVPEVSPEHPFGEYFPTGEAEPEVEPEAAVGEPQQWPFYQCTRYANPWAEPEAEPEGEPEAEPESYGIGGGAYAEPPAPLLQPPNFRERGVYSSLAGGIAAVIIVLNIAVLVALARKPKQRKSLSFFIGLIAAFDLIGGIQFLWFSSLDLHLMITHANMWILVMCGLWMLSMAPQIGAQLHLGLHLLAELKHGVGNAKFDALKILIISLTVFAFPIALFIPPLAGWNCIGCINEPGENYCERKCSIPIFPFTKAYVLLMTVMLIVAIVATAIVYILVWKEKTKKSVEKKVPSKSGDGDAFCTSSTLLFIYILFTFPVAMVMIADFVTVECNPQLINAFHATLFVTFLSNFMNPFIVFGTLPSMRNVFLKTAGSKDIHIGTNGAFNMEEDTVHDVGSFEKDEEASKI